MANEPNSGVPWYGWLILAFHLIVTIGILWMTHSLIISATMVWLVTGVWALGTAGMGLIDFVLSRNSPNVDATALDRWSVSHFAAGIVFGFWYIPLLFVLIIVFIWECFEFSVTGFGDQETMLNKLTDMGVAVLGWAVVVVVLMVFKHAPFPLASPVESASAQHQAVKTMYAPAMPDEPQQEHIDSAVDSVFALCTGRKFVSGPVSTVIHLCGHGTRAHGFSLERGERRYLRLGGHIDCLTPTPLPPPDCQSAAGCG